MIGPTSGPSPARLRVAVVAASLRILGGQAVQAQRILEGWRRDPAVLAWLVPITPEPPPPFDWIGRIRYLRAIVHQLLYWPLLFRELRRADIAHVFSASYSSFILSPLPALLVAWLLGKPTILHYHSGEAPDHLRRSRLARWALRRTTLNVVPSRFLQDAFAGVDLPATVVPNTIPLDRFVYRRRDPLRPRVLSTRSLEPIYDVARTLRAFARVQAAFPDATLTVVGDGSEAGRLRELTASLGLRHVTFAGAVPHDRIHQCYAEADIYVQTPTLDNMPNSVIEAFASGLPVVATRVGGVPEILADGVHGLLADDAAGVAARVLELLEDPARARSLAAAAHATCTRYEWPAVRDQWLAAYHAVLPPAARAAHRDAPLAASSAERP